MLDITIEAAEVSCFSPVVGFSVAVLPNDMLKPCGSESQIVGAPESDTEIVERRAASWS
ncbi:MAG TPA: hypothetical protein VMI06_16255 [Terriglobia bacterium]|nr:hypothetical protein [Terriglobia bacterium]